jgi:predicted transcriptional regulator
MYKVRAGLKRTQARNRLNRLVDRGILEKEKRLLDGRLTWVYWFPEDANGV